VLNPQETIQEHTGDAPSAQLNTMPTHNNLRSDRRKNGRHVFAAAATLGLVFTGYGVFVPSADAQTV
jgi:hypothetical protein